MAKKRKTPAQRSDAHDTGPPVDVFKVFHISVALAPVFARHALIEGGDFTPVECEALAIQLHRLATAIARKL